MMVVKKNIAMVSVNDDVHADDVDLDPLIMTMLLRSITSASLYICRWLVHIMMVTIHNDEDHLDDDYFHLDVNDCND